MARGFEEVIKEKKVHDCKISLPSRGSSRSAGYDICTPVEIRIEPKRCSEIVFTDIKAFMEEDEVLMIYVRSSVGIKKGLVLANTTGIIDSDYYSNQDNDGNIGFKLRNLTDEEIVIEAGERILQGIFSKYLTTTNDNAVGDRMGGIGSTNK